MSGQMEGRKLHLVGVGGAGMSGLALAAAQLGASVSGSDQNESSYVERLRAAGVAVSIGHAAENVPEDADIVRSTAIRDENPELVVAAERGQRVMHRSELLAELAALRPQCVTVAGTHGKTTTTAMIAHVLDATGADPSYFVGGEVTIGARTTNAHMGAGEVVVVEADESDGSFKRYSPDIAVVTNIEFEHPETWHNLDELLAAFAAHVAPAKKVVIEAEQPRRDELGLGERAITFSTVDPDADYYGSALDSPDDATRGTSFSLGDLRIELGVRGEHNVKNALAAIAALEQTGVAPAQAADVLAGFTGVARRFELIGKSPQGAIVYDDYAHHPTEVRAALETARSAARGGRVVVFYQPHLFSRAQTYRREFAEALSLADVIVVLDIYPARERQEDFPGMTGWVVATDAADYAGGRPVHYAPTFADAQQLAGRLLREGDLCVAMGAGTITDFSRELTEGSR